MSVLEIDKYASACTEIYNNFFSIKLIANKRPMIPTLYLIYFGDIIDYA